MNAALHKRVSAELMRLSALTGRHVSAEQYVEEARDPASPLHDTLEWDDAKAGEQWRINQARAVIRSIRVEVETLETTVFARAFVRDPDLPPSQGGYVETMHIKNDRDRKREVIRRYLSLIEANIFQLRALAQAFGLDPEVEAMLAATLAARGHLDDDGLQEAA